MHALIIEKLPFQPGRPSRQAPTSGLLAAPTLACALLLAPIVWPYLWLGMGPALYAFMNLCFKFKFNRYKNHCLGV